MFGEHIIRLTVIKLEGDIRMNDLRIASVDDLDYKSSVADPSVWVGNFHDVNYIITTNGQNEVRYSGIGFESITKYRSEAEKFSLAKLPRPAATKIQV